MKLKVPVNSLTSAKQQIKAGADEFYVTFSSGNFKNFTFSGRGKDSYGKIKSEVEYEEFEEIVKLAHENNVVVEMAANTKRMMDDFNGGDDLQKKYLNYVEKGIEAGADRIITADIGNIILIKKHFPNIPISASVFMETFNTYQVKFLESLGVQKIVLDHSVTIPEIEALVKSSNIGIEVFGHLGCSFIHYTCSLYHTGIKNVNFGLPCLANYNIKNTDECIDILDTMENCSICALQKLSDIGVSSIKIVGRDVEYKFGVSLTYIYSTALSMIEKNETIEEVLKYLNNKFDFKWWKDNYCHKKCCKYGNTEYHI
jgi:putative protease